MSWERPRGESSQRHQGPHSKQRRKATCQLQDVGQDHQRVLGSNARSSCLVRERTSGPPVSISPNITFPTSLNSLAVCADSPFPWSFESSCCLCIFFKNYFSDTIYFFQQHFEFIGEILWHTEKNPKREKCNYAYFHYPEVTSVSISVHAFPAFLSVHTLQSVLYSHLFMHADSTNRRGKIFQRHTYWRSFLVIIP